MPAFNGDKQVEVRVSQLRETFNCPIAIETGTLRGETAKFLSSIFLKVFTIEAELSNYAISQMLLIDHKNVRVIFGDSGKVLDTVLEELVLTLSPHERIFFYLDAHWNEYWPLLDELRAIGKHLGHRCVIMIDDIQVPNRPDIPFDSYNGNACSYEYVKPVLDSIFGNEQFYTVEYLFPQDETVQTCHAKLLILPKLSI